MKKYRSIAIDGPSGSGKSSLAKNLASKMGFAYLDTGALYRAVGLYVRDNAIPPENSNLIISALWDIKISIEHREGKQIVYLSGEDVTERIRENDISFYASSVSKIPEVREMLYGLQRSMGENHDIIMDGRDIGTVILPHADVKIFLTAAPEQRAKRRCEELRCRGENAEYGSILKEIIIRDEQDSNRGAAPLKKAPDAVILDNSEFDSPEETLRAAVNIVREKLPDVIIR